MRRVLLAAALFASSALASADPRVARALDALGTRAPALLGVRVRGVEVRGERVRIDVDRAFLEGGEVEQDLRMAGLIGLLEGVEGLRVFEVTVEGHPLPVRSERWQSVRPLFDPGPPRLGPPPAQSSARFPYGAALGGKRIAVSAGHGWIFKDGTWDTQRSMYKFTGCGSCRGIVEDFFTSDFTTHHLIPLLEGMGAQVVQVREPDHSTDLLVVDDADGASFEGSWNAGVSTGGWAGGYRTLAPNAAGRALFQGPRGGGPWRVATYFLEGSNRSAATPAAVLGAEPIPLVLDQRRMGRYWRGVGWFWAGPAGLAFQIGSAPDGYAIADAVRFGGGWHATAGKPWWQMSAAEYVREVGRAPSAVANAGDVTIRPLYAEYVGADAFLSIHANATGDPSQTRVSGTSSYRFTCRDATGVYYPDHSTSLVCDDPPGSRRLQDLVHGAMLAGIRADFDPNWIDRGKRIANFGEVRELDDTPGVLIETGFFTCVDRPGGTNPPLYPDNRALHDPRWRSAAARGIARGLAAFFGSDAGAPPPPPTHLRLQNQPDGSLQVSWRAAPGALGYRLVLSTSGRAYAPGPVVERTTYTFSAPVPGAVYAVRVASLSAAGEGTPSHAAVARARAARVPPGAAPAEALLVDGYDRLDAWVQEIDNTGDYGVEVGAALAAADAHLFFDGAADEAVEDGDVAHGAYRLLVWNVGRESIEHQSLSAAARAAILAHRAAGGALLLSGAEIGYDLSRGTEGRAFLAALGAVYAADDGGAYAFEATSDGPLAGLGRVAFDDGTHGTYAVDWPDVFAPAGGSSAVVALRYPAGGGAAIAAPRSLIVGVPLETVWPLDDRTLLVGMALEHLVADRPRGDRDLDGMPDTWESAHGLDLADFADAALDGDGDAWTNLEEYRRGTDPWASDLPGDAGPLDAGAGEAGPDAGEALDAGAPDANLAADAGPPVDAGVGADAGTPADAGSAGGLDANPTITLPPGDLVAGGEVESSCGCGSLGAGSDALWFLGALPLVGRRRGRSGGT